MGLGYKGGAPAWRGISENISRLANSYPYSNGYFGVVGTTSKVRIIYSDNPRNTGKDFYEKISFGGVESKLPNGKGMKTNMADGTIITFRPKTSSDNNPGVDINISYSKEHGSLKQQKIHFEKTGSK